MATRVRVGGQWLDLIAPVGDVQDSTIFRTPTNAGEMGWSGCYEASCTFGAPFDFAAPWFARGATFEVVEAGCPTWRGRLTEPEVSGDGWSLHAFGYGAAAAEWPSIYDPPVGSLQPWSVPDDVLDQAVSDRDFPILRRTNTIGASALWDADGEVHMIDRLLDRATAQGGQRWWVDEWATLSLVSAPTAPEWSLLPGSGYMGTADDEYVSHLLGLYVSAVDGSGNPSAWTLLESYSPAAEDAFGRRYATVDLTPLGLISPATAATEMAGRFDRVGGRMGFTNGLDLDRLNLLRLGFGGGDPMDVRAGDMLTIPGLMDTRSQATVMGQVQVVLGEVTRFHAEGRAYAKPVGLLPRDFQGALSARPAASRGDAA